MSETSKTIAQSKNFIVLDKYIAIEQLQTYQSEADLENELIQDLINQGYEYCKDINAHDRLLANAKECLEKLNQITFNPLEWKRFVLKFLDKPSDGIVEKTRKIHDDYVYDFKLDNGELKNIYLFDKKTLANNKMQVINQFEQEVTHLNRYDVTILVNGLPLVQIELKRRGVAIREAFNQIHKYSKESFNSEHSLFKFLQVFVISNGTDTRYFANTTTRNKNSFDFTMNLAKSNNELIRDIKDFTATFLSKHTLLNILLKFCVFDISDTLLIMRPYQIAAVERILWKINSSYESKNYCKPESGGYIWHTTGSGKTLTSFKAAQLATKLEFIDKVFFVVDRKDLDYQTMREYQRFSPDSVNGSENTAGLRKNLDKNDNKIIVTTIQKLNKLIKSENKLDVYQKQVVFIFDECHRSQFGEAQKNIKAKFKKFYQFGFTGTPILPENAYGSQTTASVFGAQLHSYVITDAIRDEKVLKFKVDYNAVRAEFKSIEQEQDEEKIQTNKEAFLHPQRIEEISQYILNNFNHKTHRHNGQKGFNAMFAVSEVKAAKLYYESFKKLQKDSTKALRVATIFSFAPNEEQTSIGEIRDENFEPSAMDLSSKEFLESVIDDYNATFKSNFNLNEFQNYYRDLAKRVKDGDIDLLIVVGMFLTGFDAVRLNTLFVDKNLRYHGLIQAYSRTNRIYDATKSFGNIVCFRDLEQATIDAISLFGKSNARDVILEKPFEDYMQGFDDDRQKQEGFLEVVKELEEKYPKPQEIQTEKDKKEFVKLFGKYLRLENKLQNYDEFYALKDLQEIEVLDEEQKAILMNKYGVESEVLDKLADITLPSQRALQDYRSSYHDIRESLRQQNEQKKKDENQIDWSDVTFEVELLKSQEINLDYILELLFEYTKKNKDKENVVEEITRLIRSSLENRAKESLIVDFINTQDLDKYKDKQEIVDAFIAFARVKQEKEAIALIEDENLKHDEAMKLIKQSLKKGAISAYGMAVNDVLPKMSPLHPEYKTKKDSVFEKISKFIQKFKGIGFNNN